MFIAFVFLPSKKVHAVIREILQLSLPPVSTTQLYKTVWLLAEESLLQEGQ